MENCVENGAIRKKYKNLKERATNLFFAGREKSLRRIYEALPDEDSLDFVKTEFFKAFDYNTQGGKCFRGLSVVELFIVFSENPSAEALERAVLVGWIIECIQAVFLVLDDIMDNSETRRGRPCWYKQHGVGLNAINHAFFLKSSVEKVVLVDSENNGMPIAILNMIFDTFLKTCLGQSMDMQLCRFGQESPSDFSLFTFENYCNFVRLKTTFYSFVFSFNAARVLADIPEQDEFISGFRDVLTDIGLVFQVQDDYLDVYGDPAVTGKLGTDIKEGKCTWLVVQALWQMSDSDKALFAKHYGVSNPKSAEQIKELYDKYDLKTMYDVFVDEKIQCICQRLDGSASSLLSTYYKNFLGFIKNRKK